MASRIPPLAAAAAIALFVAAPATAFAQGETDAHAAEHEHPKNVIGLKQLTMHTLRQREQRLLGETEIGVGIFYERVIVPTWFELEMAAAYARPLHGDEHVVPLDLIAKLPFELGEFADYYIGAGPALIIEMMEHETLTCPGAIGTTGFFLWPHRNLGVDLEVSYAPFFEDGSISHEVTWAVGAVARL